MLSLSYFSSFVSVLWYQSSSLRNVGGTEAMPWGFLLDCWTADKLKSFYLPGAGGEREDHVWNHHPNMEPELIKDLVLENRQCSSPKELFLMFILSVAKPKLFIWLQHPKRESTYYGVPSFSWSPDAFCRELVHSPSTSFHQWQESKLHSLLTQQSLSIHSNLAHY